jgi:hypothetical protein
MNNESLSFGIPLGQTNMTCNTEWLVPTPSFLFNPRKRLFGASRYAARKRTFEEFITGHDLSERDKKRNCFVHHAVSLLGNLMSPLNYDFTEIILLDETSQIISRFPFQYMSTRPVSVILERSALQNIDFYVRQLFGYLSAQSIHHTDYEVTISDVQLAISAMFQSANTYNASVAMCANQAGMSKVHSKYEMPAQFNNKSLCILQKQPLKYPPYAVHQELSLDAAPKKINTDTSLYMSGVLEFFSRELCCLCCKNVLSSLHSSMPFNISLNGNNVLNTVECHDLLRTIFAQVGGCMQFVE